MPNPVTIASTVQQLTGRSVAGVTSIEQDGSTTIARGCFCPGSDYIAYKLTICDGVVTELTIDSMLDSEGATMSIGREARP